MAEYSHNQIRKMWRSCLSKLEIIPGVGIGNIYFGMTREEVDKILGPGNNRDWSHVGTGFPKEWISVYYADFIVEFFENKVVGIEVFADVLSEDNETRLPVFLHGISLFEEKAEDVVKKLEQYTPCVHILNDVYGAGDKDLATEYEFDDMGVALWREDGFRTKLLSSPQFLQENEEEQEYLKQRLYFDAVYLYIPHERNKYFNNKE